MVNFERITFILYLKISFILPIDEDNEICSILSRSSVRVIDDSEVAMASLSEQELTLGVPTGLVKHDGTPIYAHKHTGRSKKSESSKPIYVEPGKVERKTWQAITYEIEAAVLLKECFVDVWNDVENTHYKCSLAVYPGHSGMNGPWFDLSLDHSYTETRRIFTVRLTNWSHTWGRWFSLHIEYDT